MEPTVRSYKDLKVWRAGMDVVKCAYVETQKLPNDEKYGLVSQMRRSAISIPSNIAEGHGRRYRKEFAHFISTAIGSFCELETQISVAKMIGYEMNFQEFDTVMLKCGRLLYALHRKIDPNLDHSYRSLPRQCPRGRASSRFLRSSNRIVERDGCQAEPCRI